MCDLDATGAPSEESTCLACTLLCAELENLKIETRLTSETPVSEMGEYGNVMR